MRTVRVCTLILLGIGALLASAAPGRAADDLKFPLQDGDTWVMAGDSITAQKLHSNYIEAFCYARYPKMTFRFRNSGVGGDTIPKVLARFDYDVAAWKPTVVSVELGMNDKGGFTVDQYLANMARLTERIQSVKARPVFFTASPVNNGDTMAKLGGNARLNDYAVALKKFAAEQHAPYADQFHALLDVWGHNKPREPLASAVTTVKVILAKDDRLPGAEHLRAFIAEAEKDGKPLVAMLGDPVHPQAPGQLMMAAALLRDLGADGFVSTASLDASGKMDETKGCKVSSIQADDGKLAFDREDECLPIPIPDEARPVVAFDPTILQLSEYTLKVSGLKGNEYKLTVNGKQVGTVPATELEKGVNLTAYGKGPIADQGKEVLAAISAKEGLVQQWRGQSKTASAPNAAAEAREKLEELTKKVEEADAKIRTAAKPRKLHFELVALAK
jgi:lysophospholipase L1-like esterase